MRTAIWLFVISGLTGCMQTTKATLSGIVPSDIKLREMSVREAMETTQRKSKRDAPGVMADISHPVVSGMLMKQKAEGQGHDASKANIIAGLAELAIKENLRFSVDLIWNGFTVDGIAMVNHKEWGFWVIHGDGKKEPLRPDTIDPPKHSVKSEYGTTRVKWTRRVHLKSSRPFPDKGHISLTVKIIPLADKPPFEFSWDIDRIPTSKKPDAKKLR